jgi:hypothetical protein
VHDVTTSPPFPPRGDELGVAVDAYERAVLVGFEKAILFGSAPDDVRFMHRCDRTAVDRGVVICAPRLQIGAGHAVVATSPLTIVPSILCPDCGTHGFVKGDVWVWA